MEAMILGRFNFLSTGLAGLIVIEPQVFADQRGFFMETYHQTQFAAAGLSAVFVQDNHSQSAKGTLRGLHFQKERQQGKLVRVVRGEVFDVAVDLRKGSPTYKRWYGVNLSADNKRSLYIPEGFAHGFLTLSEVADFVYKCTDFYHPEDEGGLVWNDPEIGIKWPLERVERVILSDKDQKYPSLGQVKIEL